MAFAKIIAFDRPLAAAAIPGRSGRFCTEAELAAIAQDGYNRGVDSARALADQQMVQFRADIEQLRDGVLRKLSDLEPELVEQFRTALPGLALELARRLLANYEPPAEVISRLCAETLAELLPERENLELAVSARDAALLEKLNPAWLARYPGLRIRTEPSLTAGDCQVRSRFGLTDARQQTKLAALTRSLAPA
jgi:flagellar assembly protein FliH